MRFHFLNHAGFLLEQGDSVVCFDPWMEGRVFEQSWSLIDQSTSDLALVELLRSKLDDQWNVHVFLSHEHPDHLRPKLLSDLIEIGCNVHLSSDYSIRLQDYLRKRNNLAGATKFSRRANFVFCAGTLKIKRFTSIGGDSAFIVSGEEICLVNLNDYFPENESRKQKLIATILKESRGKAVIAAAQFSWAGWVGGEAAERDLWIDRKHKELLELLTAIRCSLVIPFANFARWTDPANSTYNQVLQHLNSFVNECAELFQVLIPIPHRAISLDEVLLRGLEHNLESIREGLAFWEDAVERSEILGESTLITSGNHVVESGSEAELKLLVDQHDRMLRKQFPIIRRAAFKFGVCPSVTLKIRNTKYAYRLSRSGVSLVREYSAVDGEVEHSYFVNALFRGDFGFETALIGLQMNPTDSMRFNRLRRYFMFELLAQRDRTLRHPLKLAKYLLLKIRTVSRS